jgi:hypothetical protein
MVKKKLAMAMHESFWFDCYSEVDRRINLSNRYPFAIIFTTAL